MHTQVFTTQNTELFNQSEHVCSNYWQLLSQRASGKLKTNARWIRDFVRAHSSYQQDSRVSEEAVYDLLMAIDQIQKGERKDPSLFVKAEKKSKTTKVND